MVIHSQRIVSWSYVGRKWLKGGGHPRAVMSGCYWSPAQPRGLTTQMRKNTLQNLFPEACSSLCWETKLHRDNALSKSV